MSPCMRSVLLAIVLLLGIRLAQAADWPNQIEGDLTLNDYACISGDKFATLKLHYTTIGTPRQDAQGHVTNAVLLLHGTGGTGKEYLQPDIADHLFKPGQVLDASRYYVVLPDGIGAGGSSKPSDGLHGKFPRYGYNDQVSTQQITLARLGVDHLKLVSGISMGGMQTWLWAERFPEAMDAAVPIASMPMQVSGRNLIWSTDHRAPDRGRSGLEWRELRDLAHRVVTDSRAVALLHAQHGREAAGGRVRSCQDARLVRCDRRQVEWAGRGEHAILGAQLVRLRPSADA